MPVHDWEHFHSGLFHHFHQQWIAELCDRLNGGVLPLQYYALIERQPPTRFVMSADTEIYARKANRIAVRHPLGDVVAVLEIVSPGNKSSRHALQTFVEKSLELLNQGIHLLIIDLLPPTRRDPQGIHAAIWQEILDQPFELPPDKPLTLVSYSTGTVKQAFVEPIAVGDILPAMPLFLAPDTHVPLPLEETYTRTWSLCPAPMRELFDQPG